MIRFKTVKAIKEASLEELRKEIGLAKARVIRSHFDEPL